MIIKLDYLDHKGEFKDGRIEIDEDQLGGIEPAIDYVLNSILNMSESACIYELNGEYQVLPSGKIKKEKYEFIPVSSLDRYKVIGDIIPIYDENIQGEFMRLEYQVYGYCKIDGEFTDKLGSGVISSREIDDLLCVKLRQKLYELNICKYVSDIEFELSVKPSRNVSIFETVIPIYLKEAFNTKLMKLTVDGQLELKDSNDENEVSDDDLEI